jgi:hypothetical protein
MVHLSYALEKCLNGIAVTFQYFCISLAMAYLWFCSHRVKSSDSQNLSLANSVTFLKHMMGLIEEAKHNTKNVLDVYFVGYTTKEEDNAACPVNSLTLIIMFAND